MGYDLYRENEGEKTDYFRWNIWGFPPVRFLAELYGWIPQGTLVPAWTDSDGNSFDDIKCWYDSNDGQVVCEEDAQEWAKALKLAIKDLEVIKEKQESVKLDNDFMDERKKIYDMDAEAIRNYFNTKDDIEYVEKFIVFLNKGEFRIY